MKRVTGLALLLGAVLAACGTLPAHVGEGGQTAWTDLQGYLAASEGDLNAAAAFDADTLRRDPNNTAILLTALFFTPPRSAIRIAR